MNMKKYEPYFTKEYMMGPNCVRLLDEMNKAYPDAIKGRVLDMGCGCGITSLYLGQDTGAEQIFAMDLWIPASDNFKRIRAWKMEDKIIPIHGDATQMPYADEYFDTIVSLDAYHYFGREKGFFQEKILPLMKKGGRALMAVPGIRKEWEGEVPALMQEWAGDEWDYFHSCAWWKDLLQTGYENEITVEVWESRCHDKAWQEWFQSGHEYALSDKACLDKGLDKLTNFVMIAITRK